MSNVLATDAAVHPAEPGRYDATISTRFNLPPGHVNGGYSIAVCVRALAAELKHPDPLVVSATFLRQVFPGPATIAVEQIRSGRRLSVGEARLVQNGSEAVRVVATFADLSVSSGRTFIAGEPPMLPPPEECQELAADFAANDNIRGRTETRWPSVPGWLTGSPSGDMTFEFWLRLSGGEVADTLALPALVDFAFPAIFEIGEFSSTTIELTAHVRARPAPGWLACRVATRYVTGGYHEENFDVWDSTGQLVAQSHQLQLLV